MKNELEQVKTDRDALAEVLEELALSNECLDLAKSNYDKINARMKKVEAKRDALAARVQEMREVVQYYWDNGPTSSLYYKANEALATPDDSAAILARRDAAIWQEAAEVCMSLKFVADNAAKNRGGERSAAFSEAYQYAINALRAKADELLKGLEKEHG